MPKSEHDRPAKPGYAWVTLFKPSGKWYMDEQWRIPNKVHDHSDTRGEYTRRVIGPFDMEQSPNFHRIDNGPVLVHSQEPWVYPYLLVKYIVTEVGPDGQS